ncbi:uncharacterized protein LOC117333946 [Pecten maximus]|uniref:uncharacterized protein LOC117333946 n=1 Tax=Pecten maximus TaxID=6579 RepID=UPI0014582591|nr:uncharacterized protein LOC117333946 [Pecten maximus]
MSSSEESEPSAWQDSDDDEDDGQDSNLELDGIVNKFNFRKATSDDEYALQSSLSGSSRRLISKGNAENVKRAVAALQKQICYKGFPRRRTPACNMANCVVDLLDKITEKRVPKEETRKIMFEFLLACISTGPSSSHASEIIQKVMDMKGMTSYINKLGGPELTRLLDTIKAVEFTSEKPTIDIDDQATYWGDCMLHALVSNIVNREAKKRLNDPVIHGEMVDLHTSFLRMMGDFPKAFSGDIKRVLRGIQNGYDEDGSNMLEVVKKSKDKKKTSLRSKEIVERQFKGLKEVVLSEKFGRKEQLERTVEEIERTLRAIRETPEIMEFWDSVIQFMKELALSEKCAKYPDVIKPYKYFFGNLEEKRFKKNPELVTKWIPVFGQMLQKSPSSKCLESWAFSTATRMADYWVQQ